MRSRGAARLASAAALATLVSLGASGCVNYGVNSAEFCNRNATLLATSQDNVILNQDQAVYWDDALEKTMRYSEDGTRQVRLTARKLADAYATVRGIAGNDKVKDSEVKRDYTTLRQRRSAMRSVCAEVHKS